MSGEAGLCGWTIVVRHVIFPADLLRPDSAAFWFLVAAGVGIGYLTGCPMTWWLVRQGTREVV